MIDNDKEQELEPVEKDPIGLGLEMALAAIEETKLDHKYIPPASPVEQMYDDYHTYICEFIMFDMIGENSYPISNYIKDKEDKVLRGAGLVQYYFSLHTDKEISQEQAAAFAPFFYDELTGNMKPDPDEENDEETDEEYDERIYSKLLNLFESKDFWETIKSMFDYYIAMEPYLRQELDKLHDLHPECKNDSLVTFDNLKALVFIYRDFTEDELEPLFEKCRHNRPKEVYKQHRIPVPLVIPYFRSFEYAYKVVKAAREAAKHLEPPVTRHTKTQPANIPHVSSLTLQKICYPLDKLHGNLWGGLPIGRSVYLKAESDEDAAKGKTADIITILDFEELDGDGVKITRNLTIYDKRVFIAVANLVESGQYILTPAQIDKAMGATTKTNAADKKKILESLSVLVRARVTIDNTTEAKLYNNFDLIRGDFALLKADIVTAYIDGQLTEGALQVAELPKLYQFSKNRKQVTTVPIKVFASPISKTPANMTLEDYLIRRIAQMNNPKSKVPNKIALTTLYDNCGISDRKQRSRLVKDKLPALLDYYVKTEFIKSYTLDNTGITIISPTKK